jgi:lipopolysaccharide/colanic/teichoic acid biosynthesis glycosyltransferase
MVPAPVRARLHRSRPTPLSVVSGHAHEAPLVSTAQPAATEAPLGARSPNWPRSLPVQAGLLALLAVVALLPLAQHGLPLRMAVPVILAVAATRLAFEALAPEGARGDARRIACAAMASATGCAVGVCSALVLGLTVTPAALPLNAALGTMVLTLGLKLRGAELRLRARVRRLFLIGSDGQRNDLTREAGRSGDAQLVGWLPLERTLGAEPDQLADEILAARSTVLVLSEEAIRDPRLVAAASAVNLRGVRVRPLRSFYEEEFGKVAVSELSPAWFLFDIAEIHRQTLYGRVKRLGEVLLGSALLAATAPLFPLIALGIRRSSPGGGVFFCQERVGRHGRVFRLAKFRTMHPDPALEHGAWLDASRSRIFPLGALLRKFRLDELPQLWNVIGGDLSLVGPRPEQPAIVARLEQAMPFYSARHTVRPGLTGWAQVSFGYGGSNAGALSKLQYDLFYVKRQSLRLDLRIAAATVRTVLLGAGR